MLKMGFQPFFVYFIPAKPFMVPSENLILINMLDMDILYFKVHSYGYSHQLTFFRKDNY